jgi:hypothetical protein
MILFIGIAAPTACVSAQTATGVFNPPAQFHVGSRITIRSLYGIAMLSSATRLAQRSVSEYVDDSSTTTN